MTDTDRTVQVPVSLIERIAASSIENPDEDALIELSALLPQSAPTDDPAHGWDSCSATAVHAPHEWNVNEGEVGFGSRCPGVAEPPRIEDLAPGTTFTEEVRWTVTGTLSTGLTVAHSAAGEMCFADRFDPSTIRDVTPPAVTE